MNKPPKDDIPFVTSIPALPDGGRLIVRTSLEEVLDGDVGRVVAWDPTKCPVGVREKMRALLEASSRPGNLTTADKAAWQYISGGPAKVDHWNDLDKRFQKLTRRALGLTEVSFTTVRLVCVDSDDEDEDDSE